MLSDQRDYFLVIRFREMTKHVKDFFSTPMTTVLFFLVALSFCQLKIRDFHSCLAYSNLSSLSGQRYLSDMLIWRASCHRKANHKVLLVLQD